MKLPLTLISSGLLLALMDSIWLKTSVPLYSELPRNLLADPMNYAVGLVTWTLIIIGIYLFPFSKSISLVDSLINGALFGATVYGVYECTNYTIIKGWPLSIVIIDTLWGIVLCGIVTTSMFLIYRALS